MTLDRPTLRMIATNPTAVLAAVRRDELNAQFAASVVNPYAQWWECWLMQPRPPKGYATFSNWKGMGATSPWAHRIVASAVYGPIPEGHDVDHLCFTRNCVNPFHLRFLPASENRAHRRPVEVSA